MPTFSESIVEDAALAWLDELGYAVLHGPDIGIGEPSAERIDPNYRDVILEGRLRQALVKLNPELPPEALEDAYRKLTRVDAPSLIARNRAVHRMLVDGTTVEYSRADGSIAGAQARVIDFDTPDNNDWLAVNQFTVAEGQHTRRPDVVLFVNGLPLAVIELKNSADENATIWTAFHQLQTYQAQIPFLFSTNATLVVSDGVQARIGTLGAGREWFKPWRKITGGEDAAAALAELQVVLEGVFDKRRFLDLLRYFIVFEDEGAGKLIKKIAGYHQFHAVNVAVEETLRAAKARESHDPVGHQLGGEPGDRRVGVVWHTQGSGKSLTMAFYAGRVILHPAMENPTVVMITDRNDLDDQLFGTFARCRDLLRQPPVQAENRADLREKLRVASGGVVFTTIQKFLPEEKGDRHPVLSERRNIVVIADEAHRSQYDFIDGFARHMRDALPHASFIGFTGTPIEKTDANTRAVFGDYISVYDIQRAVMDGATVPIYYESRLAKLELNESERPKIDPEFEEATEGEEVERKEKLKSRWAQLEAVVGSENRVRLIARDLVEHFESRLDAMEGKAMIVCMSRRICVDLYKQIVALRPSWQHDEDDKTVRNNLTIDWTVRENVRAQLRVLVKHILRKYGYPPDKQEKATQTVLEQAEVLSGGWAPEVPEMRFRLRIVQPRPEDRYVTCVPFVPLKVAAGAFSDPQQVDDKNWEWVEIQAKHRLRPGMFVARVVGRSMEPDIPDGSYCLFAAPVEGSRQGKTVLVQMRDAIDPETGERYTVKRYESEKVAADDSWRHSKITLKPVNPEFEAIELTDAQEEQLQVIAECIEVLKTS